jgi:hypothetical protein
MNTIGPLIFTWSKWNINLAFMQVKRYGNESNVNVTKRYKSTPIQRFRQSPAYKCRLKSVDHLRWPVVFFWGILLTANSLHQEVSLFLRGPSLWREAAQVPTYLRNKDCIPNEILCNLTKRIKRRCITIPFSVRLHNTSLEKAGIHQEYSYRVQCGT